MIPRYARPEMTTLWEAESRFSIWLDIETHAMDAMVELGTVPAEAAKAVRERGAFDVARIDEIEREVKHDVIAFLTSLAEHVGPEARFVHQGMTSSDVLDTCFNVQLTRAADILLADIDALLRALKNRAMEHKMTPCIGRSHAIHAEPTTFGLKMAQAYAEFDRNRARMVAARAGIATCAISGAVGTFANIDPAVEARVAEKWTLRSSLYRRKSFRATAMPCSLPHWALSPLQSSAWPSKCATFSARRCWKSKSISPMAKKGSSAMPHKRNPVLTENLTGLARLVRGMALPAMENVALWHERDISHSSVERMIGPDATITLDFALTRLTGVIDNLVVYPERMQANLDKLGGLVHSQRVLLALTQAGVSREDAYRLVQRNAMPVWEGKGVFLDLLKADQRLFSTTRRSKACLI